MKYLVKNAQGKTVLATFNVQNAVERALQPGYKLIRVPVTR